MLDLESACIHDSIVGKPVIMRRIMTKFCTYVNTYLINIGKMINAQKNMFWIILIKIFYPRCPTIEIKLILRIHVIDISINVANIMDSLK